MQTVVVTEAEGAKDSEFERFKQDMDALTRMHDQQRSWLQFATIFVMLFISYHASKQSLMFGGAFVDKMARPGDVGLSDEAAAYLKPASAYSSFAANFCIPIISADVAVGAFFSMLGCVLSSFCSKKLKDYRHERGWHTSGAFGFAIGVLAAAIVGSVANTLSSADASIEAGAEAWSLDWTMMVFGMAIVQLAQNTRSLVVALQEDMSHVSLAQVDHFEGMKLEGARRSARERSAMASGDPCPFSVMGQVVMSGLALLPILFYNYTASIKPVTEDLPSWGLAAYGIGILNFAVKSALFLRSSTSKLKRVASPRRASWGDWLTFAILFAPGVFSMGGAANFPKKYFLHDQVSAGSTWVSLGVAEAAALALNFGDMFDAAKIAWYYTAGAVLRCCQSARTRYGKDFDEFLGHMSAKVASRDPHADWHHEPVLMDEEKVDDAAMPVSYQQRNRMGKLLGVSLPHEKPKAGGDYQAMSAVAYRPKGVMVEYWKAGKDLAALQGSLGHEAMEEMYQRYMDGKGGKPTPRSRPAAA